MNDSLISGSDSSDGAYYTFLDRGAKPGVTLYYWLEEVSVNYKTVSYGPAVRSVSSVSSPGGDPLAMGRFRTETTGGVYRLRYESLAAAGFPMAALETGKLGVRIKGVPVAVHVNAAGATLQPGDSLLFYARKSERGLPCSLTVESSPLRMRLANAAPVHGPGTVYLDEAGANQRLSFVTDPANVRYFLIDFNDAPVWVLDVSQPANAIMLAGYSFVSRENGMTAVYLSYDPESGPARCLAVQDASVMELSRIRKAE